MAVSSVGSICQRVEGMRKGRMSPPQRVLIVDSESHTPLLLRRTLATIGDDLDISLVLTCRQAEQKVKHIFFDVIVAEMQMPDMSGLELACLVRYLSPQTRFILMTDHYSPLIDRAVRELRIADCLVRPFSYYKLRETVHQALQDVAAEKRRLGYQG